MYFSVFGLFPVPSSYSVSVPPPQLLLCPSCFSSPKQEHSTLRPNLSQLIHLSVICDCSIAICAEQFENKTSNLAQSYCMSYLPICNHHSDDYAYFDVLGGQFSVVIFQHAIMHVSFCLVFHSLCFSGLSLSQDLQL